jgi:class 3 adenylate cyclase
MPGSYSTHNLLRRWLEPPAGTPERERKTYTIRMASGATGITLLGAGVFLSIGTHSWRAAIILGCGVLSMIFTLTMARRWNYRLGTDLGFAISLFYILFLSIAFPLDCGFLLYILVTAMLAFMIYSPTERIARRLAVGGSAVVALACGVIALHWTPIFSLSPQMRLITLWLNCAGTAVTLVGLAQQFAQLSADAEARLADEREISEHLLRNILPAPIATRLKQGPGSIADLHPEVTVLFADLVGFTPLSEKLSTVELLDVLNELFSRFDELSERHGLEKIKTIGDAYMVAGGLPEAAADHARRVAQMALDMRTAVADQRATSGLPLELRIGIHSGPVIAGIIGVKKFSYDLWGDTVNTASRMESHGEAGRIHVSEATRMLLGESHRFSDRGESMIKGKGKMRTFFLDE